MKKIILSIAIAAIFASCSNHKASEQATNSQTITSEDTSGFAEFKEWKDKKEMLSNQQTFTSEGFNEAETVAEEKPEPVVIYRDAPVKQQRAVKVSRPSRRVYKAPAAEDKSGVAKAPAPTSSGSKREAYGRAATGTEAPSGDGTTVSNEGDVAVSDPAEVPAKKEGWSKAAKGTAIGGTSGAVIGSVISKNKTRGAVIGGIVGAAGGYIFGRTQDKKDGRY